MDELIVKLIGLAGTAVIGVLSYFLKRTMNQVDGQGKGIRELEEKLARKADVKETTEELKKDIREIRDNYTPKGLHEKDFDECREDIKHIKSEYLTKDDFIREMNKMDRKLDQMLEIMLSK